MVKLVGEVPHLIDGGLSILQYTDDMILFMEHDLEKANNMKLLLLLDLIGSVLFLLSN